MARVEGSEVIALPRERVWELLNDPATLGAAIPGCHGFERDGDAEHRYRTTISVAVGAVKGDYEGTVTYSDIEEPEHCTISVAGRGDKGAIDGRGAIELRADGERTEVGYRGDFKLTGPVAGIGQRLAPGVSRKLIVETLRNLERSGAEQAAASESQPEGAATAEAATVEAATAESPTAEADAEAPTTEAPPAKPSPAATPAPAAAPEPQQAGAPASTNRTAPEPFSPYAVPGWARFAGGLALGILIGILIGRLL